MLLIGVAAITLAGDERWYYQPAMLFMGWLL